MRSAPWILLHQAFAEQARRTPHRLGVQEEGRRATFGELALQVARVRTLLLAKGIEPGARVALDAHLSLDGVAGLLGILEAGPAVVPKSPSDPAIRTEELLGFSGVHAVVDTPATPFVVRWAGPTVRSSEGVRDASGDGGNHATGPAGCPPASPPPKGLPRHRLDRTRRQHPCQDGEVGCQKAHVATTDAIYELFEPLLQGAPMGRPTERAAHLATRFGVCPPPFRCMRDDAFVSGLARAIEVRLDALTER